MMAAFDSGPNCMHAYQRDFLDLALRRDALRFGEFTLKSGRISPYFFNAGRFDCGADLAALGGAYAASVLASDIGFDMLFGPAYKGIPLAAATAVTLATKYDRNVPVAYNRKEAKAHGEGGTLIGTFGRTRIDRRRRDHRRHRDPRIAGADSRAWRNTVRRADRAGSRGARPGRVVGGAGS